MNAVVRLHADRTLQPQPPRLASTAAFVTDELSRSTIAAVLDANGPGSTVKLGGIDEAIKLIANDPSPRILIVDLTGVSEPMASLDRLAEVCLPGARVIAIGETNDIHFYRLLRSTGIAEYLVKPVAEDALRAALETSPTPTFHNAAEPEKPISRKGVTVVIGARGGAGATMVAVSLAWIFAEQKRRRTVLVDLDLSCGSAGLAVDVEPGHGLGDALANPDRIDSLLIASATAKLTDNFYLLSSEQPLDSPTPIQPDALPRLAAALRHSFQHTIFEASRQIASIMFPALDEASTLVIVTDYSLAGARDTGRLIKLAEKAAPGARRLVVANRVGKTRKGDLSQAEIEKALGVKFSSVIPEDPVVSHAVNSGKPVPAFSSGSAVATSLRGLAETIEDSKNHRADRGVLSRLFFHPKPFSDKP